MQHATSVGESYLPALAVENSKGAICGSPLSDFDPISIVYINVPYVDYLSKKKKFIRNKIIINIFGVHTLSVLGGLLDSSLRIGHRPKYTKQFVHIKCFYTRIIPEIRIDTLYYITILTILHQ